MNPDPTAPEETNPSEASDSRQRPVRAPRRGPRRVRNDGRAFREEAPRGDSGPEGDASSAQPMDAAPAPGGPADDGARFGGGDGFQGDGGPSDTGGQPGGEGSPEGGFQGRRKEPFWMRFRRKRLERKAAAAAAAAGGPPPAPGSGPGAPHSGGHGSGDGFREPASHRGGERPLESQAGRDDGRTFRPEPRGPRDFGGRDRGRDNGPRPFRDDRRGGGGGNGFGNRGGDNRGGGGFRDRNRGPQGGGRDDRFAPREMDRGDRGPEGDSGGGRPDRDFHRDGPPPSQMSPLQLAARIVEKSNDDTPADMVLRQTLFRRRGLSPADAAWVSRAVFSFFRWNRWSDPARPLEDRIQDAVGLADRFAEDPTSFSDAELVANSLPDWVGNHLQATPELVRALQAEPALWLRCRPQFTEETGYRLRDVEPGPLPDSFRYFGQQDLYLDRGFQSGAFEIQDLASQAVGLVCNPRPPEIWWDACAGEGGKTLHLSSLMAGKSLIWASDRAAWRLDRLRQRAGRARVFNYRAVHWDGGENPPSKTRFDGILVDAPCSGLGTWGRNPHSRWTTPEADIFELAEIQKRLLNNVANSLKPGGRLVYSVCTLTQAETTGVTEWFTQEHPEFETDAVMNPFLPDDPPVTEMQLWPHETGGNGMFIAVWRKT